MTEEAELVEKTTGPRGQERVRRTLKRVATATAAAAVATVPAVSHTEKPADAYALMGRWWPSWNHNVSVWNPVNLPDGYNNATADAMSRWNATGGPINFTSSPGYPSSYDVLASTHEFYDPGFLGQTILVPNTQAEIDQAFVQYNPSGMDDLNQDSKSVVGVHEFGHVQGLAENGVAGCGSSAGIMHPAPLTKQWGCSWTTPQSDDKAGINAIY